AGAWHDRHQKARHRPETVRRLMAESDDYQLKFVVGSMLDAEEALEYLEELGSYDPDAVMMMPRGTSRVELTRQSLWLGPWCQARGIRYCDRAHIRWFGNRRGT
ncbi:MAG: radical SAM protein, partial [Pirellulaceae bacterium]